MVHRTFAAVCAILKLMKIYFSGIGGVGLGPLAQIAVDAGYEVSGSDRERSSITDMLASKGISFSIGQDGSQIASSHTDAPIDWFVYTAALPYDHPELVFARKHGIRISKRDELLAEIIRDKNLKLLAVAGTHGKTTTSGMLVWALKQLGVPISYSVGTTLSFGPSGAYDPRSQYFVYECDEYDRNFLHFEPRLSLITALDYDHPDTYPTKRDYQNAFVEFIGKSHYTLLWEKDLRALETPDMFGDYEAYDELMDLSHITLAGNHVRQNAYLVEQALYHLSFSSGVAEAINSFPGTARRFEKLAENLYSDYAHHPAEIAATLQLAKELSEHVVLVYQPHQNIRQYEVKAAYTDCMNLAEKIYWLPTYLSREDPKLEILTPQQLTTNISNKTALEIAELDDGLWQAIQAAREQNKLVLCMGAGTIDGWVRSKLSS